MSISKPLILILCTGNSCRSQMAEGFLREAGKEVLEVASAGSNPSGYVHPLAVKAMEEVGIDISGGQSKHLDQFLDRDVENRHHRLRERRPSLPRFSRAGESLSLGVLMTRRTLKAPKRSR